MARNDEDNEEVEPQNKEDLPFLERTGKLDMELDQGRRQELKQRQDCWLIAFREEQTHDNKVLNKLEENLNTQIQELPVVGFKSSYFQQFT